METTVKNPVASVETQQGEPTMANLGGNRYENVIKGILANGGKRINGIRVKNVNVTEKDNYVMVSFTLGSEIRGFISDDNGATFKEGKTVTLFTSLYAIAGAMKEDEDLSWMANALLQHPEALNLILNGATIDIVQQDVPQGVEYRNPFTTQQEVEGSVYDHDVIINNVVKFKLGNTGLRFADKLADKLLGW